MSKMPVRAEDKLLETIKTLDNTLKPKHDVRSIRHTVHTIIEKTNTKKNEVDT
jgi:hypothetical protein